MKKGDGKNPKPDGSFGHKPKQQETTGTRTTAGGKRRAPFQSSDGEWKKQRTSSSSSSSNHPWFLFYDKKIFIKEYIVHYGQGRNQKIFFGRPIFFGRV
jgi:hypothetical protein